MKRFILISLAFFLITFSACDDNIVYMNKAQIMGFDDSLCGCCGGYSIKFSDTNNQTLEEYLIYELPNNFIVDNDENFPIDVKVNWEKKSFCDGKFIDIIDIELD